MRTAFIQELISAAQKNDRIFLIVGDLGFSVVESFAEQFPDRFLNAGVAEQNMTGIAVGLAMEGFNVFTYSIGNFPTLRCMEQVRYDVAYHRANVKIVSVGGGYSYGALGVSHHATEDLAMMRAIPGMAVCAPGDPAETRRIASLLASHDGPAYLRLGKAGEPIVHEGELSVDWGRLVRVREGKRVAVLTTGSMLKYASDALIEKQSEFGLYSFPFVKPMDREGLIGLARIYDELITLEEHQRSGGFGSAVVEQVCDLVTEGLVSRMPRIRRIAIPDMFLSEAGSQDELRRRAGLVLPLES